MPHRDRRSSGGQKNSPPRPRPPLRARRVLRRARSSARPAAAACAKSREKSRRVWRREPRFPTYTAPSPGPCWSFPQPPRAGNGPCGPPAVSRGRPLRERRLWSSGGQEPSRPIRRQVEMTRVTLPDGRLGPSSLTTHTRLSGRPQEAITAATVPLAQYSASSNPAARSTVVHSRHGCVGGVSPPPATVDGAHSGAVRQRRILRAHGRRLWARGDRRAHRGSAGRHDPARAWALVGGAAPRADSPRGRGARG